MKDITITKDKILKHKRLAPAKEKWSNKNTKDKTALLFSKVFLLVYKNSLWFA